MDENENINIEKGCRDVDNCVHETGMHFSGLFSFMSIEFFLPER